MSSKVKTLAKHSVIYGFGSVLTASAGFILIPIYTHVLSTTEYGVLEILNRLADILIVIMFMGVRQAYIRIYFEKDTDEWRRSVTASALVFSLISSFSISILIYLFGDVLAEQYLQSEIGTVVILLVLIWLPLEMLINIGLSYLQINMKSHLYISVNFIRLVSFIILNYVMLYYFKMGVKGVFLSQVIITGIISLVFVAYFIKWTRMKVSFEIVKELLHFGLPYIPTTFFGFVIANSDKYFLSIYSGLDEVGVYALGSKIGILGVMVLMEPFNKVWSPFVFSNYKTPEGPKLIGDVFLAFTGVSVYVALGLAITAPAIIPLISSEEFHSAHIVVPYVALSSALFGMMCLSDIGILIAKKTKYKPIISMLAAGVCVVSSGILIYKFGIIGAAVALIITQLAYYAFTYFVSNKYYQMKLRQIDLAGVVVIGIATYLLINWVSISDNLYLDLFVKVLLATIVYLFGLFAIGVIRKELINDVRYFVYSRKKR